MNAVGIIAEYNPFHNGHEYHVHIAKKLSCADTAIVCMSASFTQRGEPACLGKFARARHALLGGADMVIELPDLLSCSCAERFAYGGVQLLSSTGLVDALAFGSECGDITMLKMKAALSKGLSYPAAASMVMREKGITIDTSAPNDMLAIEYMRQLNGLAKRIDPIAIPRIGAGYNEISLDKAFASASALRKAAAADHMDKKMLEKHIPEPVFSDIMHEAESGRFPAALDALSPAILFALRSLGACGIAELADVSEGLENPLYRAALSSSCCCELLEKVKTKRYTLARLRRILCYSLIGTTSDLQKTACEEADALYIRVLGVKKEKLHLLSALSERAVLPVVISASDAARLPENASRVLAHSRRAHLIHALSFPKNCSCVDDLSHPLITV